MNLSTFLDLIYPQRCAFCQKIILPQDKGICRQCSYTLPFIPADNQLVAPDLHISICLSVFYYKDAVRQSLIRYKFQGKNAYYKCYANLIAEGLKDHALDFDIVSWVPLSKRRYRKRGYDQAKLIANEVALLMNVPCIQTLIKYRNNPPQSGTLDENQRRNNVKDVYRLKVNAPIYGVRVLLIDDIITTGATLSECASILLDGGAKEIFGATVARTLKEN